ncbi:MAG TPA: N-acetylmuramoyl-L-alanine amidase [Stenotrophomonas sp.]|nr:N-acetylmuramoyl-L-alanine amidase [Stenotrophomonas sp.]
MPTPPSIHAAPLPYERLLPLRGRDRITQVVIHCTELPDLATAREYGERVLYDSGTGNSGHYYIDRDGRIEQYVALERVAHHVRGHNAHSLGIELVNRGRYPHWLDARHQQMREPYPEAQLLALESLLHWLRAQLPALADIAGHDALDTSLETASDDPSLQVRRKLDPGPQFPWPRIRAAWDAAAGR